jgi:hypothetical protein
MASSMTCQVQSPPLGMCSQQQRTGNAQHGIHQCESQHAAMTPAIPSLQHIFHSTTSVLPPKPLPWIPHYRSSNHTFHSIIPIVLLLAIRHLQRKRHLLPLEAAAAP